jgi:hypothetical protein
MAEISIPFRRRDEHRRGRGRVEAEPPREEDRRVSSREKNSVKKERTPMEHDEMIEILEEIARNPKSYPSARISAIRALLELEKHQEPEPSLFDELEEALPLRNNLGSSASGTP